MYESWGFPRSFKKGKLGGQHNGVVSSKIFRLQYIQVYCVCNLFVIYHYQYCPWAAERGQTLVGLTQWHLQDFCSGELTHLGAGSIRRTMKTINRGFGGGAPDEKIVHITDDK